MFGPDVREQLSGMKIKRKATTMVGDDFGALLHSGEGSTGSGFIGTSLTQLRSSVLFVLVLLTLIFVGIRIVYLQVRMGEQYAYAAQSNKERILPIPSERGLFYDANGVQLTENIPNFSLAITPQDIPRDKEEREKMIAEVAKITQEDPSVIRDFFEQYGNYSYKSITLKEDIDYTTALRLQIESVGLPGVRIQRGSKRLYLWNQLSDSFATTTLVTTTNVTTTEPSSLSHVIGYLGKLAPEEFEEKRAEGYLVSDVIGKTGLEKTYEEYLRGEYGHRQIEVDAQGREQQEINKRDPVPGNHVRLSLDLEIQKALERAVKNGLEQSNTTKGSAIALDPRDGSILAMVSLPAFDNNDFSSGIDADTYAKYIENPDRPLFNRAIGGTYPSGSTIKPAMAMAALQEGIVTAQTSIRSVGGIAVGPWFFPDWQAGGHGATNVRKSIADSVNTFYYYIGGGYGDFLGLGVDRITTYLNRFQFARKTGIDIPGEQEGFIPSREWKEEVKKERWYVGDTYNLSIGQGDLLVTPLQIAALTASVANGGTQVQPHFVDSIIDPVTKKEKKLAFEQKTINFVDKAHVLTVKQGMGDCVDIGSCRRLSLLPFTSGGKTGTAQWSSTKEPHAWFTSFAPYEQPEIVVTVLIEEGEGGSITAAPIAYEFYRWWGQYTNKGQ